jgi:hypothetical protein
MKELWKALIARLVYSLTPKPPVLPSPVIVQSPAPPLTHGICVCGHFRCVHTDGKGKCHAGLAPHSEYNPTDAWLYCICQIFIEKRDDHSNRQTESLSPEELEKLYRR